MWKAFKAMFATPEVIGEVVSRSMNGLDSVVFTKQEQLNAWLLYIQATMPMNISRRIMATAITALFIFHALIVIFFMITAGMFTLPQAARVAEQLYTMFATVTFPTFMVSYSWYFWKGVKDGQETTKRIELMDMSTLISERQASQND